MPVASFLSGGLDSSIIAALAHRRDPSIEAYTIAFRPEDQRLEAMPDDAPYARKMATHLGMRLHEIEIHPDVVTLLPRMVDILDEPIGDPAAINTLLMCEAAREAGVKVLLSGMGADEMFGGYRKHLAMLLECPLPADPGSVRSGLVAPAVRRLPVAVGGKGLRHRAMGSAFRDLRRAARGGGVPPQLHASTTTDELAGLLDPELAARRRRRSGPAPRGLRGQRPGRRGQPDVPGRHSDVHAGPQPHLHRPSEHGRLHRGARPICGPRRVSGGLLRCRPRTGSDGRVQKAALRDVAREWLPEIVDRPKASFGAPLRAWVSNDLSELVDDVLMGGELVSSGFLRREPLHRLVEDQRTGRRDESKQVWQSAQPRALVSQRTVRRSETFSVAKVSSASTSLEGLRAAAGRASIRCSSSFAWRSRST